jgi:hypothetical protein
MHVPFQGVCEENPSPSPDSLKEESSDDEVRLVEKHLLPVLGCIIYGFPRCRDCLEIDMSLLFCHRSVKMRQHKRSLHALTKKVSLERCHQLGTILFFN